jgi:hypothetical protein
MAKATDGQPAQPADGEEASPEGAFEVGITARPTDKGSGSIGVQGVTESEIDQSVGVLGEATAEMGIVDGVRGSSASINGTGVRGTAGAFTGVTAGVWGSAASPDGYGAFFFNLGLGDPGGPGLFAAGALNASADLILGGNLFWPEADQDDGRIRSDPFYESSDLVLQSNDFVQVELDADGSGENADFTVVDKDGQVLFNVDSGGTTFVLGDLTITGDPQGGLVSIAEVQQLIDDALQDHLEDEHPKIVFVTSQIYDGNLGGLSGADAKCAARATSGGLIGTFKAWISGDSATQEARDRMSQADVPYRRVDFVKVADNWTDLIDGTLDAPINVNEHGNTVVSSLTAYTNTDPDGSLHEAVRECGPHPTEEWNSNSENESGGYGTVGATNGTWSWVTNNDCMTERRLYCVQQ